MEQVKISKGIEISKLGKLYLFDNQCEWSKEHSLQNVGKQCIHYDCIKSFWINKTIYEIREELTNLMK